MILALSYFERLLETISRNVTPCFNIYNEMFKAKLSRIK